MTKRQKQLKTTIKIDDRYTKSQRAVIAQEIIDFIVDRSKSGKDVNGRNFVGYSKSYVNSLDFKNAGKSKGSVDLTLSGDMLASIELLKSRPGEVTIGFKNKKKSEIEINAQAVGNTEGTYGSSKANSSKARPFLGLKNKEVDKIESKYPLDDIRALKDRIKAYEKLTATTEAITEGITLESFRET